MSMPITMYVCFYIDECYIIRDYQVLYYVIVYCFIINRLCLSYRLYIVIHYILLHISLTAAVRSNLRHTKTHQDVVQEPFLPSCSRIGSGDSCLSHL